MSNRLREKLAELTVSEAQLKAACYLVPVGFGFYSLWLGADSNWDLTNYHLYDPFAFIHGKLDLDLAPAGMQSYFNPLLDFLPYFLNLVLPAPLAGFLMGMLHGLTFPLLVGITHQSLKGSVFEHRHRLLFVVAGFGCLSANYLSELGNSMGDDTTALFVLGAVFIILKCWDGMAGNARRSIAWLLLAGFLAGAAAGLKLTNALYALALAVALLTHPGAAPVRLRLAMVLSLGVVMGVAVTGGYWMIHMWQHFGNPLYPQFSAAFPNPLTLPVNVADTHWRPKSGLEVLLWPFIFALDSSRVGQVAIHQVIWPIAYALLIAWFALKVAGRARADRPLATDSRHRFLIVFFALSYGLWMQMFSIYRYIVAIEVLAPLVILIVLLELLDKRRALQSFGWILGLSALLVVCGGAPTWGHAPWATPVYTAQLPKLEPGGNNLAVLYSPANAWAWLATLFPPDVAFAQVHGAFPESEVFKAKLRHMVSDRPEHAFALIDGAINRRADSVARINQKLRALGLLDSAERCQRLQTIVARFHLRYAVGQSDDPQAPCQLALLKGDEIDLNAENRRLAEQAVPAFAAYGLAVDARSCQAHVASIGSTGRAFQWCKLTPR